MPQYPHETPRLRAVLRRRLQRREAGRRRHLGRRGGADQAAARPRPHRPATRLTTLCGTADRAAAHSASRGPRPRLASRRCGGSTSRSACRSSCSRTAPPGRTSSRSSREWADDAYGCGLECVRRAIARLQRNAPPAGLRPARRGRRSTRYHYRIIYQTFFGMRDVIDPLRRTPGHGGAAVPVPQAAARPGGWWSSAARGRC